MIDGSEVAVRGGDDVAVVCGSRSEFIRLAPVIAAFANEPRVVVADPDDVSDRPIPIVRLVEAVAAEFSRRRPRVLIVHGGALNGIATARVAEDDGIPVVYAEAGVPGVPGVETFSSTPSRSSLYAATTIRAAANLRRRGVDPARVTVTGSTVVEATRAALAMRSGGHDREFEHLPIHHGFVLAALDHPENVGEPRSFERIIGALRRTEAVVVLVVSPAARAALERNGGRSLLEGIVVVPDLPWPSFVRLARRAELLVSDSAALQEECTVIGTRLLVPRRELDRPEAADAGFARLVDPSTDLVAEIAAELRDEQARELLRTRPSPYGDGHAGARVAVLAQHLADGYTAENAVAALDGFGTRAMPCPAETALVPSGSARP